MHTAKAQVCLHVRAVSIEPMLFAYISGRPSGNSKAPYSSKIDIFLSKKGLLNWYIVDSHYFNLTYLE